MWIGDILEYILNILFSWRREQKTRNKEILEKILKPIYNELSKITNSFEELTLPSKFNKRWGYIEGSHLLWTNVKEENCSLLKNINKQTKNRLEDFLKN